MKLLIVGSKKSNAIELIYKKYLQEFNKETYHFPLQNLFEEYYSSLSHKVLFKLGLSQRYIYRKLNFQLKKYVEELKPDIIWIFKGLEILPETLETFRMKKIKLVNFNPDHPFIKSSRSSWNKNVYNSVPLYDLHFCYSKLLMKKIQENYRLKTEWLPFGYELDTETFEKVSQLPEINKVCFLGNPDKIRAGIIKFLVSQKINIDIYGHEWKRYLNENDYLKIYDALYGIKFWEKLRQYRVQLNIFRPHNIGSHNMRTFEIPAIGGIQLAPDSPEHREFFENGKEIFLYNDKSNVVEKIKFILNCSEDEARHFRNNARQKSLIGNYSYKFRSEKVFTVLKSL